MIRDEWKKRIVRRLDELLSAREDATGAIADAWMDAVDDATDGARARLALLEAVVEALPRCRCGKVATCLVALYPFCEACSTNYAGGSIVDPLPYRAALLALKAEGGDNG